MRSSGIPLAIGTVIIALAIPAGSGLATTGDRSIDMAAPYKGAGRVSHWISPKPNAEWMMWGRPTEPEADFSIGIVHKVASNAPSTGLRDRLRTIKRLKPGIVLPTSSYATVNAHGGMFKALPFLFKDLDLIKECLGFINTRDTDRYSIYGWYCAEKGPSPDPAVLECALGTLSIRGRVQGAKRADWCDSLLNNSSPL